MSPYDSCPGRCCFAYIHCHGNSDHGEVKTEQRDVFGQSVGNQSIPYKIDEVKIEAQVDDEEDAFLAAVPDVVDMDPSRADLKSSRNPYDENTDIDQCKDEENGPF